MTDLRKAFEARRSALEGLLDSMLADVPWAAENRVNVVEYLEKLGWDGDPPATPEQGPAEHPLQAPATPEQGPAENTLETSEQQGSSENPLEALQMVKEILDRHAILAGKPEKTWAELTHLALLTDSELHLVVASAMQSEKSSEQAKLQCAIQEVRTGWARRGCPGGEESWVRAALLFDELGFTSCCGEILKQSSHPDPLSFTTDKAEVEGPKSAEEMMVMLQRVPEESAPVLVAARLEAEERRNNMQLREEQDATYRAALEADQARERQRKEEQQRLEREAAEAERKCREEEEARERAEREAAERLAALARLREEKATSLGPEPEKGPNVTRVLVRFPTGERKDRRFHSDATIQTVYDYVDSLGCLEMGNYTLVSNFPRVSYGPDKLSSSLKEAGLHTQASLFVEMNS